MKNIFYKIQYFLLIFVSKLICLFPEQARFKFGDFLGALGYYLIKKRRVTAITNLHMAFPEKDQHEIEEIAKKSFQVMTKAFLSTLWLKDYLKIQEVYPEMGRDFGPRPLLLIRSFHFIMGLSFLITIL